MTIRASRRFPLWRRFLLPLAALAFTAPTVQANNTTYTLPANIALAPFRCSLLTGTIYTCPSGIDLAEADKVISTLSSVTLVVTGNVDIPKKAVIGSIDHPIDIIASGTIKLSGDKNTDVYGNISANTIDMGGEAHVYGNCSSSLCKGSCDKLNPGGADDHLIPASKNCTTRSFLSATRPTVTTNAASNVSPTSIDFNATVSSNGSATTAMFGYSTTDGNFANACGSTALASNTVDSAVNCSMSGLACNTTYYWRPLAFNGAGITYGIPTSTKTAACVPSVSTGSITDISATGATLHAAVSSNGSATTVSFDYGTSSGNYATSCGSSSLAGTAVNSSVSCSLGGLTCNTTYYWRPSATNAIGTSNGAASSFTTAACPSASKFDAYETDIANTEAATVSKRVLKTRVASSGDLCRSGSSTCALRIAAFTADNAVATAYTGTVSAQLQYCANVSRTNGVPGCGGTWTDLGSAQTASLIRGVGNATFSAIDNAYEIVRVRISSSTVSNGPWDATDHFAIRPASLTVYASDQDSSTAGTIRSLTIGDPARSGDFTHVAGKYFTLSAVSGKSNYAANKSNAGTGQGPIISTLRTTLANTSVNGVLTLGNWSSAGGTLTSTTASYDEVGSFAVTLEDRDFAAVDVGDGSTEIERYFSGSATLGRFIPEKFLISDGSVTAAHRSATPFTYFGKDGFAAAFTLTPVNAAGATTKNYLFSTAGEGLVSWPRQGLAASPLPNGSTLSGSSAFMAFNYSWSDGKAIVSTRNIVSRPSALTNETLLTITARPFDSDGITATGAVTLGTTLLRFGRLRILPVYGSDLFPLRVPVRAEFYNGGGWSLNVDDSATAIPAASLAIDPLPNGSSLTFLTPPNGIGGSSTLTQGETNLIITPAVKGVGGAFLALNLGAGYSGSTIGCRSTWGATTIGGAAPSPSLMHLAGNTCGNTVNTLAPAALIKFGSPRAPFTYLRERY